MEIPAIALIADRVNHHKDATIRSRDLEFPEDGYFNPLAAALDKITQQVTHYRSPVELIENISSHKSDFVISIWSGSGSRNRKILVPAICEAYNLMYLGPDPYTRLVCQDKSVAKAIIKRFDLRTPEHLLVYDNNHLENIDVLRCPLVVKPSLEGGSIGISRSNLVHTYRDARKLAAQLMTDFEQPVMVEEFVKGREVTICIVGNAEEIVLCRAMEVFPAEDRDYFKENLFSLEIKKNIDIEKSYISIDTEIDGALRQRAINLFRALGSPEIMRIDGRLNADGFHVIELEADVHLGIRNDFDMAFNIEKRFPYEEVLRTIIRNSIKAAALSKGSLETKFKRNK